MCNVMVICPSDLHGHAHGHNKGSWNFEDAWTQQPPGRFTPNWVHWNCLWLMQHHSHLPIGGLMGVTWVSLWTLQMLELSNHWTDSLQINFIGTILACSCAMPWLPEHSNHWADLLKSNSLEPFWSVCMQRHGHLPIRATWVFPQAQTGDIAKKHTNKAKMLNSFPTCILFHNVPV